MVGNPISGDECQIVNNLKKVIGRGVYNSKSMYTVRVIAREFESQFHNSLADIISSRVGEALQTRVAMGLFDTDTKDTTTAFRLVNGEGDCLSGLVIDVYHNVAVVESSALWAERNRELIEQTLRAHLSSYQSGVTAVVWKAMKKRLIMDGWKAKHENICADETALLRDDGDGSVVVLENGIRYKVLPGRGQKTGFYCDQRESRLLLRALAAGATE